MIFIFKMISGIGFSKIAKWVVDPRYPDRPFFNYDQSTNGDCVFINRCYIDLFIKLLPDPSLCAKKYILLFHNSDKPFDEHCLNIVGPYAIRIYALNKTVDHPMVQSIPIGFVDRQLPFLETLDKTSQNRDIEIYMNFTVNTNPTLRNECVNAFKDNPNVFKSGNISVPEYYSHLLRSKYVLCPEGEGIDTHRVYESLLCGATPVVLRNCLAPLYEKLPVCIINKWTDEFYVPENKTFPTNVLSYLIDIK